MRVSARELKLIAADIAVSAATFYIAFVLRTDQFPLGEAWTRAYVRLVVPLALFRVVCLHAFGMHRIAVRHTSVRDAVYLAASTVASSALFYAFLVLVFPSRIPRSPLVVDWLLNFMGVAGIRLAYRIIREVPLGFGLRSSGSGAKRVLLIGAGTRGAALVREMRRRPELGIDLVGLIDDDPAKRTLLLHGAPVVGTSGDVPRLVEELRIDEIIIAISRARGRDIQGITRTCENLPVRLRISPGFAELDSDTILSTLRDVSVEDLLQRDPVQIDLEEVSAYLTGQRVLITGAGGSIGSEIVRQITAVNPETIMLLGHGENSIFEIEQEMRGATHKGPIPLIVDVRDYDRLLRLLTIHRPTVVFHAAAHKHVPLMESNPEEAITNNVLGTRNLARASGVVGVKRFVMISTDKAVNPMSIMGVSKRVAERVVQAEALRSSTEFATVRFGNVLGSRGSVVPLMRRQIERGGPVTVTHAEATRYFMTIPEAVQLVIQAGALGGTGAIYILDMGEPIRIMDLAHSLIRLSGLIPGRDIAIEVIGLRPGEKVFEELLTAEEGTTVTMHERIYQAAQSPLPCGNFDEEVDALIAAAQQGETAAMMRQIRRLVPHFNDGSEPSTS